MGRLNKYFFVKSALSKAYLHMTENKSTFDALKEMAKQIDHGEISIILIVYKGEIVGFDQISPPIIKFRQQKDVEK